MLPGQEINSPTINTTSTSSTGYHNNNNNNNNNNHTESNLPQAYRQCEAIEEGCYNDELPAGSVGFSREAEYPHVYQHDAKYFPNSDMQVGLFYI